MDLSKLAEESTVSDGAREVKELSKEDAIKKSLAEEAIESLVDGKDPEGVTDLSVEDESDGESVDWEGDLYDANNEDLGKGSANDIPDLGQRLNGNTPTV